MLKALEIFFGDTVGVEFSLFGDLHFAVSTIIVIGVVLIFSFRHALRRFGHFQLIRRTMAIIFFANMTIWYLSMILRGVYDWTVHLPLHLCFITGYFFMYTLWTDNRKLYRIVYFFTFIGPLPAMVWPDLAQGYDRFLFWQFFISHHLLLLTSVYCLVVMQYEVEPVDILRALVCGNVLCAVMFVFNMIFSTNYIMMTELPQHIIELFPFVKAFDLPLFWLELTGLAAIAASFLPVLLRNWLDRRGPVEFEHELVYVDGK